jgi:hypothetical protein
MKFNKDHIFVVMESKSNEDDPVKSKIHTIARNLKIPLSWDLSDEDDDN